VPALANSPFVVDLPTVCLVSVFLTATAGALLLFAWVQNRRELALALWGIGCLFGSVGVGLLRGAIPGDSSTVAASTLVCCAYGVLWAGARTFEGRKVQPAFVFAGAALWLALCQWSGFSGAQPARLLLLSAIFATYTNPR
jgi:hypothetical protein